MCLFMEPKHEDPTSFHQSTPSNAEPVINVATNPPTTEATLGARIGGYLIDILVVIVISMVVGKISSSLGMLVAFAYLLLRDSLPFLQGQSLGKKVMKIKAVTEEGTSLSGNWGPGLIRNVVLLIPFFPIVELIVLISKNGKPGGLRRLGDEWGKTKVITAL